MTDLDPMAAPTDVPPALAATYRAADRYGFLQGAGGRVRYACWNACGTVRGSVMVLTGRGEFIEKYATEIVGELLDRGLAVFAIDWHGQGLSDRMLLDRGKGHVDDFVTYMADLKLFLDKIVAPVAPRPLLALSHSMGGHVLLRHLAEYGSKPFAAGVMVAPMTALKREALLRTVLMLMPEVPAVEHRYLYGSGPFTLIGREFATNRVTHDERRYRFTETWFKADPRLALGGPTVGWARQAVRSMMVSLAPGYLERIDLPLLLLSAGQDRLVDPASHGPVAGRLPRGELVTLVGARHEIMMETDPLRAEFWKQFDRMAAGVFAA